MSRERWPLPVEGLNLPRTMNAVIILIIHCLTSSDSAEASPFIYGDVLPLRDSRMGRRSLGLLGSASQRPEPSIKHENTS